MPKHGGFTISQLMVRHLDAIGYIAGNSSAHIGVFGEGLGGFVAFYLALAHAPFRSAVYQNAPALLTEAKFRNAVIRGRRKALLPVAQILSKLSLEIKLPISSYLSWKTLVDTKEPSRSVESRLVTEGYLMDADFDKWYPLTAIMSLLDTPPPAPLSKLATPTLFLVAASGFGGSAYVEYLSDLHSRLPVTPKKLIEVDGSVYWMLSHPVEAAAEIHEWFKDTL